MHKRRVTKPDGRALLLYGRQPLDESMSAPSPEGPGVAPNAHLRWHPLRGEWVAYAGHRQHRTFLPPPEYNPLAPTTDPSNPTEVPPGNWDVAVFENLFPALTLAAHDPPALAVATEARALKTVLMKFDGLWQRPFPYILAFHQAPTDGVEHPEAHLHAEFYPAFRMPNRLKYLAGSEIGAGVFTADTVPEQKAEELRAVAVDIDA